MGKKILFVLFILNHLFLHAQFSDNFSDANFNQNPPWTGDTDKFIVENQQLRLNDNVAGSAFLVTPSHVIHNTQWEFWLRLAFAPSNSNHPLIYLTSDSENLNGPLNGYFIRIGKDGTENKRLYFYRQSGTTITEIMAGSDNLATTSNNLIRIKVTRNDQGQWRFFADPTGGQLYLPQGSISDNQHTTTSFFGIKANYTVSNSRNFYFDDFYVGERIEDTTPPTVAKVQVIASNMLDIHFSEVVSLASAQNVNNFFANQELGKPLIASRLQNTPNVVRLVFSSDFQQKIAYELSIGNINDLEGNIMLPWVGHFVYYVPTRNDVVFNELMANATPRVALPEHKYIELYNTAEYPINLQGWVLQHGTTRREIPGGEIPAKGYLILCRSDAEIALRPYGNVVAIPDLSTNFLTQGGLTLVLFNPFDEQIATVSYSDSWYQNATKAAGGWSLEKIDPYNFCGGAQNWRASTDQRGGTPGQQNAIRANNPDLTKPNLVSAGFESETLISLFFDKSMDEGSLKNKAAYTLDHGIGQPLEIITFAPEFRKVQLRLATPLQAGTFYQLSLSNEITDCSGNTLQKDQTRVAIPQTADSLDLVINEVLFNPPTAGVRYIEIYNRSTKPIDLKNYLLSSKDTLNNILTSVREISSESHLILPGEYRVLTPNPDIVRAQYMTNNPLGFITLTMPSMTNTSGVLVIAGKGHNEIDRFAYHENMHYALLTDKKGVALERLNFNRPTQDRSNWHSASQGVGFGTPAYQNSQFSLNVQTKEDAITVYPEIFSPDQDGHNDVLNIAYRFDAPGYTANLRIYDSRGRLIRTLARSYLLATEGILTWDGITDDNQKASIGIYIIHLEVFNPQGQVKTYRKTAVLAGKL